VKESTKKKEDHLKTKVPYIFGSAAALSTYFALRGRNKGKFYHVVSRKQ
jgi:hypothetical protein